MIKYIFVIIISYSLSASAIIIQHDIEVSKYLEFAKARQFDAVGMLLDAEGICTAVLIDRYTLLTAAHCVHERAEAGFALDTRFFRFSRGDSPRMVLGKRALDSRGIDLAVAYLKQPALQVRPRQLSSQDPRDLLNREVEFATFGDVVTGVGDEIPGLSKVKSAGKNQILNYDLRDQKIEGPFRYLHGELDSLNARPSPGGSGAPILLSEDGVRKIVAIHSGDISLASRVKPKYGTVWRSQAVFPFLSFIRDAMAFKEVESAEKCASSECAWEETASFAGATESVRNANQQDEYGMRLRHYAATIKHPVSVMSSFEIDELNVVGTGALSLAPFVRLDTGKATIDGQVKMVVNDMTNARINAEDRLEFRDAKVVVDFQLPPPRVERLPPPDLSVRCCGMIELAGKTAAFFFGPARPRETREWTIFSAGNEIVGGFEVIFVNPPPGFDLSIVRGTKTIIVKATK